MRRTRKRVKKQTKSKTKSKLNSKSFYKLNCSPENDSNKTTSTCYSDSDLLKLRDIYNQRHPDRPIQETDTTKIWHLLKQYYSNVCNKESCWVRQMVKNTKLEKELLDAFAPESPVEWKKNPNEWLSSVDIIQVMNQYEKKYKCFDFIGPSPIDYDTRISNQECVWNELCNFDLQKYIERGIFKIGVIFNLDPHYKGGSHWVSLFVNVKNKTIFYFDSTGDFIPKQIKKFVDEVTNQGKKLSKPINFKFDQNHPVEHQYGNTECGIYSIFFITHMLQDKINGYYLKTHILKDKYIEKFRKIFYNEHGDI